MMNIFFKCKQLHVHVFEKSFLSVKLGVFVDKWRPRRTIIFCSWGAEEYGLIGSTEWIEVFRITHALALHVCSCCQGVCRRTNFSVSFQQYVKNLATRAVAYLNVDIAVQGMASSKHTHFISYTVFLCYRTHYQ